eukprot:9483226-Pyramimonas_sp.AAC.3
MSVRVQTGSLQTRIRTLLRQILRLLRRGMLTQNPQGVEGSRRTKSLVHEGDDWRLPKIDARCP